MAAAPDHANTAQVLASTRLHANDWFAALAARPVRPTSSADELRALLAGPLPPHGADPVAVTATLAHAGTGGAVASAGPRYFGFVVGGSTPAALAGIGILTSYVHDPLGNLQTVTAGSAPAFSQSFDAGNRIQGGGYSFDAAGNLTADGHCTYAFDAENQLTAVGACASASYVYNALVQRVRSVVGGVAQDFILDPAGRVATAMGQNMTQWNRGEIYAAGRHLAAYADGGTYFSHADWLDTDRVNTAADDSVAEICTSLPFGDDLSCGGTDASPLHFTGKYRDSETSLDYFSARYYSSQLGRFLTPDWSDSPEPIPYANLSNPQSLNLYSYVLNNPASDVDLDGHICCFGWLPSAYRWVSGIFDGFTGTPSNVHAPPEPVVARRSDSLDINKMVRYLDDHAHGTEEFQGQCAAACHRALVAGGLTDISGRPGPANQNGPYLLKHGAIIVANGDEARLPKGYEPLVGDIAVFQGGKGHPYGHMEIYDGKQWVSDTRQTTFSPNHIYPGGVEVYRFPHE